MLVEGPTLARGYLNNPEKTEEAFVYAPKWATDTNEAGEKRRFYKSGDLVRYNSSIGALTYIGRKDTQVKLHGQRVELGEIESRLTADVDIQLALVHVPKAGYAQGKLVTIFCFAGANHTEARELSLENASEQRTIGLRQRIGTVLPAYMVPGVWLSVESVGGQCRPYRLAAVEPEPHQFGRREVDDAQRAAAPCRHPPHRQPLPSSRHRW